MSKSVIIVSMIGLIILALNCIPFRYGDAYSCMSGMETFTKRYSFRGLPLPYEKTYLFGDCTRIRDGKPVGNTLDYRAQVLWLNFVVDTAFWLAILFGIWTGMKRGLPHE